MKKIKYLIILALLLFLIPVFTATSYGANEVVVTLYQQETPDLNRIRYVAKIEGPNYNDIDGYDINVKLIDNSGTVLKENTVFYPDIYGSVNGIDDDSDDTISYAIFTMTGLNKEKYIGKRMVTTFTIRVGSNRYTTNTKYYEIGTDCSISNLSLDSSNGDLNISFDAIEGNTNPSNYIIEYKKNSSLEYDIIDSSILSYNNGVISGTVSGLGTGSYTVKVYTKYNNVKYSSEESTESIQATTDGNTRSIDSYITSLTKDSSTPWVPTWGQEGYKGKWNYIDGVFLNSLVGLYNDTNETKYMDFVEKFVNYYLNSDGVPVKVDKTKGTQGDVSFESQALDTYCESRIMFDLYNYATDSTSKAKYKKTIEYTYTKLIDYRDSSYGISHDSSVDGDTYRSFSHKASGYNQQVWLDGFYMYAPFYIRYANYYNEENPSDNGTKLNAICNELVSQYKYVRTHMYNDEKGLYYHGYDASDSIFWRQTSGKYKGCSKSFWLRSTGWFISSLVDVIGYFPEGENKTYLKGLLKEALDGIIEYQDPTYNMYYQVIDQGNKYFDVPFSYTSANGNTNGTKVDTDGDGTTDAYRIYNYLETSGSSMIAYSLLKAADMGFDNSNTYRAKGTACFEAIYDNKLEVKSDGSINLKDICIQAGLGPASNTTRDGSPEYYLSEKVGSNEAKGIGPFVMAYIEYNKLQSSSTSGTNRYNVTFNTNGGSFIQSVSLLEGNKVSMPENPTKTGYTFDGWLYNGTSYNFNSSVTSNMTLNASYTANNYTITYDSDGGSTLSNKTVTFGQSVTLDTPTKTGYQFKGWYYGDEKITNGTWAIANNVTLKAKWEEITEQTEDETVVEDTFTNASDYTITATTSEPTTAGLYKMVSSGSDFSGNNVEVSDGKLKITDSTTLTTYAYYMFSNTYTTGKVDYSLDFIPATKNSKWTFVRFMANGNPIGIRTNDSSIISYSLDDHLATSSNPATMTNIMTSAYSANTTYHIVLSIDYDNNVVTITVGTSTVTITGWTPEAITGLRFMTAGTNSRNFDIDNIKVFRYGTGSSSGSQEPETPSTPSTLSWRNDSDTNTLEVTKSGSTSNTSATIGGKTYTNGLKMESSTSLSFTLTSSSTVTLHVTSGQKIKVNGTSYTATNGIITLTNQSGTITITKDTTNTNLYAIIVG